MYYFVYNFLLSVAFVAALPFLPLWLAFSRRVRPGLAERFGWYGRSKLQALDGMRPIWIHAASVGEVLAAGRVIAALKAKAPERKIIFSTFTDTGNAMARRCAGADAVFFLPLDHPLIVRRALTQIDPAALIVVETEIWPNLLHQAFRLGIPTLLLSGRLSERAFKRYLRFRGFFRRVLRCFTAIGMQSDDDRDRITRLGADAKRVRVTGNLKRAAPMAGAGYDTEAAHGEGAPGTQAQRPLLVVGSSHQGEEEILLGVFISLKKRFPDLQLAVAPRHPERFAEVEKLLQSSGLSFEKKSRIDGRLSFHQDVMIIDTLGDLGKYYARADIAFVAGSLVGVGGHNLLEPAFFKKPVLFGPFMANFRTLAEEMKNSGGGIEVRNADDLLREITGLLLDPEKRRSTGEKAYCVAAKDGAVVERSLDLLRSYVDFSAGANRPAAHGGIMAAYE
ncbi:MAG TPA: 3-deoxy-D-manno-octulosonic acid transferase [Candidatus Binatia bacterium]